jgi:hypothetical protein
MVELLIILPLLEAAAVEEVEVLLLAEEEVELVGMYLIPMCVLLLVIIMYLLVVEDLKTLLRGGIQLVSDLLQLFLVQI